MNALARPVGLSVHVAPSSSVTKTDAVEPRKALTYARCGSLAATSTVVTVIAGSIATPYGAQCAPSSLVEKSCEVDESASAAWGASRRTATSTKRALSAEDHAQPVSGETERPSASAARI